MDLQDRIERYYDGWCPNRQTIAQKNKQVFGDSPTNDLFYDVYNDIYFYGRLDEVLVTVLAFSRLFNKRGWATVNDFYNALPKEWGVVAGELGDFDGFNAEDPYVYENCIDGTDLIKIERYETGDPNFRTFKISWLLNPKYDYTNDDEYAVEDICMQTII